MVKILHLSDLHFCEDAQSSNMKNTILDEAVQGFAGLKDGEKMLIITGDFHNYNSTDYDYALDFVNDIVQAIEIDPREDIFIVPGNHDVGNKIVLDKRLDSDWELKDNAAIRFIKDNDKRYLKFRLPVFSPYCDFARKTGIYSDNCDYYLPAEVHVRRWRSKLNILHLNTALVADGGSAKDNQMIDIDTAASDAAWEDFYSDNMPSLAIGHNCFYDLNTVQRDSLATIFYHRNVSAYLCGDTHRINDDVAKQLISLESGMNPDRLSIPNVVCVKGISEKGDSYSDFGFYWHEWDESVTPNSVSLHLRSWKPKTLGKTVSNGQGDGKYIMRIKKSIPILDERVETMLADTSVTQEVTGLEIEKPQAKNNELTTIINKYKKNLDAYYNAFTNSYGLIITDISGVLFDSNKQGTEEYPEGIVKALSTLAKRHISICFTTGRGRTGARQLLLNLAQKIIDIDDSLSWEKLSSEWTCITHNGAYLLTTPYKSRSGFLASAEYLCPDVQAYIGAIDQNYIRKNFEDIIKGVCKREKVSYDGIIADVSMEPVSIRFSLENCSEKIFPFIVRELQKFCERTVLHVEGKTWNASTGSFEQKKMFEYSLVNKSDAVKEYIKRYRPIEETNILRIACGGQHGDSDFGFLSDGPSFSVGEIDTSSADTCFPVVNRDNAEVLEGTKATEYLLTTLRFYPSLCLKTVPDENRYKITFANAISGARKRSEEIFSFYNTRLAWMDFLYEENFSKDNTSRIFDVKSGAITFSDLEWVKIEMSFLTDFGDTSLYEQVRCFSNIIKKKKGDSSVDIDIPNLLYFLHTDTHVLFRGYLYYTFFVESIKSKGGTDTITVGQWVDTYRKWYSLAFEFAEEYQRSMEKLYSTTSLSIGYLTRKLILGGLDNLRNILLTIDTFYMRQYTIHKKYEETDFIIDLEMATDPYLIQCEKISKLLFSCLSYMYTGVFESQIDLEYVDHINNWLRELLSFMDERRLDYNYLFDSEQTSAIELYPAVDDDRSIVNAFFTEAFPRWRESDCFIENTASIEVFLSKVSENENNLTFWGIPYGSLEHPILASVLCEKHGLTVRKSPCYIMLHGKYESRHESTFRLAVDNSIANHFSLGEDVLNVLIDDTLTTATTIDLAVKCLSKYNIYINNIVVMRYAGLNRLNHYLTNRKGLEDTALNASAPDVTKFFDMISGLVAEAPYSKLHKYRPDDTKPYEDLLGVFDKSKNRIRNYLRINY